MTKVAKEERRERNRALCDDLRREGLFDRFKVLKEAHRVRLRGEGKSADAAADMATELALAGVRAESATPPPAETSAAGAVPPAPSVIEQELARLKAAAAEREASEAAKRQLLEKAGASENVRTLINWAVREAAVISGGKFPAWGRVKSHPPGPGAIWYLEQSFVNPAGFAAMAAKSQGKDVDDDHERIKKSEKKREAELLLRLDELDAELEARGRDAYT